MLSTLSKADAGFFIVINSHHTPFLDHFFSIITNLGNGWFVTPILLAILLIKLSPSERWRFILFSTIIMVASGLINTAIKSSVDRPRPVGYFEMRNAKVRDSIARGAIIPGFQQKALTPVHIVGDTLSCRSFPSGHANTAFSAATLLVLRFGGLFWFSYIFAFLVGYSRVYMGVHFPGDAAAGGLLGIAVIWAGIFVYKRLNRRRKLRHDK